MAGIKINESFPTIQLSGRSYNAKNNTDAKLQALRNDINKVAETMNMFSTRLNSAFRTIEQSYKSGSTTTINTILSGGGGGGGGGSAQEIEMASGLVLLQANVVKTVVFAKSFTKPFDIQSIRIYNDTNLYITDFVISNVIATNFDIVCPEDATCIYFVVERR